MRLPADRSLASWIRELQEQGRLYRFYKTKDWCELRSSILEDAHWECARCKEQGKYSRAVTVHHVNEVKDKPHLALSRTFVDAEGEVHPQLVPLCFQCHNEVHGRALKGQVPKPKLNEERW